MLWLAVILLLGGETLDVEIADTPSLREKGLMGRSTLDPGRGMLFVYPREETLSFWMKNTRIPLSIGFFDKHRRLIQVEEMEVPRGTTLPLYTSRLPAQYALELSRDWFREHKIPLREQFRLRDVELSLN